MVVNSTVIFIFIINSGTIPHFDKFSKILLCEKALINWRWV